MQKELEVVGWSSLFRLRSAPRTHLPPHNLRVLLSRVILCAVLLRNAASALHLNFSTRNRRRGGLTTYSRPRESVLVLRRAAAEGQTRGRHQKQRSDKCWSKTPRGPCRFRVRRRCKSVTQVNLNQSQSDEARVLELTLHCALK